MLLELIPFFLFFPSTGPHPNVLHRSRGLLAVKNELGGGCSGCLFKAERGSVNIVRVRPQRTAALPNYAEALAAHAARCSVLLGKPRTSTFFFFFFLCFCRTGRPTSREATRDKWEANRESYREPSNKPPPCQETAWQTLHNATDESDIIGLASPGARGGATVCSLGGRGSIRHGRSERKSNPTTALSTATRTPLIQAFI